MKNIIKILSLILIFSMLNSLLISCNMTPGSDTSEGADDTDDNTEEEDEENLPPIGNTIGKRCISTSLELIDGGTVNIKDFKGKIVVLNFWGTWCGPCKSELPEFDEVAEEYADSVVVLTVHSEYGVENAPDYVAEHFADSKMVFAKDKAGDGYYRALNPGMNSYPITIIVDARGVICARYEGKIAKSVLVSEIEKLK